MRNEKRILECEFCGAEAPITTDIVSIRINTCDCGASAVRTVLCPSARWIRPPVQRATATLDLDEPELELVAID